MPRNRDVQQPFCVLVTFIAADSARVLKAAPGAGKALVITKVVTTITTSAAQVINISEVGGVNIMQALPASAAIGTYLGPSLEEGVELTVNTALQYIPAAAGPAGNVIVEGWIKSKSFNT